MAAPVTMVEPEKEAEVVLDKRQEKGETEYFVKWKGLPLMKGSWMTRDQLGNIKELVEEFEREEEKGTSYKRKRMKKDQGREAMKKARID